MNWLKRIVGAVLDILFPPRCVICEKFLEKKGDFCPECITAARVFYHQPWKIPHVKSWHGLWQYGGAVRDSLVRFKFRSRRGYRKAYGRELAQKIRDSKVDYDVITWVPVSALRKLSRGYDQVALIARSVGEELDQRPQRLLVKWRHNRKQSKLRGIELRKRNVQGVYRIAKGAEVKGKRILLLEDIITTGATVSEAAKTLKAAGAKEVHVFCVAVANRYQSHSK